MARHLLIPLTLTLIYITIKDMDIHEHFAEIYTAIVIWAGGGTAVQRWVQREKEDEDTQ